MSAPTSNHGPVLAEVYAILRAAAKRAAQQSGKEKEDQKR